MALDFSCRYSPNLGTNVIEARQDTLKALSSIMGWSEKESWNHGLGRKHVNVAVSRLRQSIMNIVDIIDPEHFMKEENRTNFLTCHSKFQKGKVAYNLNGHKSIIYSCGDKYCPDCATRKADNGILEIYSDWYAIARKLGIPTILKIVFTLPEDISEKWALDKDKIDFLCKQIKRILCKFLSLRVKDNLSLLINPHPCGDGDPIHDRLHFHVICLPVAFNKTSNGKNVSESDDMSSETCEEDEGENEKFDPNKKQNKGYEIRVALMEKATEKALIQMRQSWKIAVQSLLSENDKQLPENLVVNFSYIPILKFFAMNATTNALNNATDVSFVDELSRIGTKKPKPNAFKHALTYNSRSFLPSLFNRIIAHDETGAIYPIDGWKGCDGQSWEDIARRAIFIAESKDKNNDGIYHARCFGLAKKRKAQMLYIKLGKKFHPLPPVSEEDASFEKKYYKKISSGIAERPTIKLVNEYSATLDDSEKLTNIDFGVHARKYYKVSSMYKHVIYIIPKSSTNTSFIIEKPIIEDFLARATHDSLYNAVRKTKIITATEYYNSAKQSVISAQYSHNVHGKKIPSLIERYISKNNIQENDHAISQLSFFGKKNTAQKLCIKVDSNEHIDTSILKIPEELYGFYLQNGYITYYAKDNIISQKRIYDGLEKFVNRELPCIKIDSDTWYGEIPPKKRKKDGVGSYKWQCEYVLQLSRIDLIGEDESVEAYVAKYRDDLLANVDGA